jgi:hypothetical protein
MRLSWCAAGCVLTVLATGCREFVAFLTAAKNTPVLRAKGMER